MLWIFSMTFLMGTQTILAQRSQYLLDKEWKFRFSHQVEKNTPQPISLPHTWNAQDALVGKIDYKRGIGNYERTLHIRPEWKGKRLASAIPTAPRRFKTLWLSPISHKPNSSSTACL